MNYYNLAVLVKHFDEFTPVCFVSIKLKKPNSKTTFKKSPANCPTPQKSHRPVVRRPVVHQPIVRAPFFLPINLADGQFS